jgi:cell division septum initiation protein DivIVA
MQKQTEDVIQPLQDELAQLEEKLREKTSSIQNLRRQIIWNDTTIQNLLNSVIAST